MIDALIGQTLRLLVLVVIAVVVAQHLDLIVPVLLAGLLGLAILRIGWPTPRR